MQFVRRTHLISYFYGYEYTTSQSSIPLYDLMICWTMLKEYEYDGKKTNQPTDQQQQNQNERSASSKTISKLWVFTLCVNRYNKSKAHKFIQTNTTWTFQSECTLPGLQTLCSKFFILFILIIISFGVFFFCSLVLLLLQVLPMTNNHRANKKNNEFKRRTNEERKGERASTKRIHTKFIVFTCYYRFGCLWM